MRSKFTLALLALGAVGLLLIPALSGAAATQLSAKLKGNQEVGPGRGDSNGRGEAFVAVRKPRKRKLCFELSWEKIEPPTAAHIHKGAKGKGGHIKVTLFEDPDGLTVSAVDGCEKISKHLARKLRKTPEATQPGQKFYVDVHNAEYPDGAIRGQLEPDG